MRLEEHQKRSVEAMGQKCTLAHLFLDQYFRYYNSKFGGENAAYHRHVLHHEEGIALITELFGSDMGKAARLHIQDDLEADGFISMPKSWDDQQIWGYLSDRIRREIKNHWEQMKTLHDRFSIVILGDTYGSIGKDIKKQLQDADLILVTGQYWNDGQSNKQSRARAISNLRKYGVVIALQEEVENPQYISIRGHCLYLDKSYCSSAANRAEIHIESSRENEATLEWNTPRLHVKAGYAGSDSRNVLSLVRIDSYSDKSAENMGNLFIICLTMNYDTGVWRYGTNFTSKRLQLGGLLAIRIAELPIETQRDFNTFLRGANVPVFYPGDDEHFAHEADYIRYLCSQSKFQENDIAEENTPPILLNEPVKTIQANEKGRDYFVGDIHGHLSPFLKGLKELKFDPEKDRVFSVGDLIDRGSNSIECLQLLRKDWFYAVMGNHERMFYGNLSGNDAIKTIECNWQFRLNKATNRECQQLLEKMHWAISIETPKGLIGVVHADVPEGMSWSKLLQSLEANDADVIDYVTWSRELKKKGSEKVSGVDWVIVGHQALDSPKTFDNIVCIDTRVFVSSRYCESCGLTFSWLDGEAFKYLTIEQ